MAILLTKGDPMGAWVALVTHLSYVLVYTPLKTRTNLNTLIGAIPGALPPVIGYVGVVGHIEPPCAVLFAVLFLWQIPHFLAIAWMYKDQYAGAGMHMLTVKDTSGRATAAQMRNYTLAMMATASFPILIQGRVHGWWDLVYLTGASAVGGWFLWSTILFQRKPCFDTAKIVLRVSLVVLPLLLLLLCLDTWIARSAGLIRFLFRFSLRFLQWSNPHDRCCGSSQSNIGSTNLPLRQTGNVAVFSHRSHVVLRALGRVLCSQSRGHGEMPTFGPLGSKPTSSPGWEP